MLVATKDHKFSPENEHFDVNLGILMWISTVFAQKSVIFTWTIFELKSTFQPLNISELISA